MTQEEKWQARYNEVLNFMGMDNDKINQLLNKSSNDFLRISDKNK